MGNYVKIEEELTSIECSTCSEGQGVEMMWENMKEEMKKCIMKYVPKKLVRKTKYAVCPLDEEENFKVHISKVETVEEV